MWMQLATGVNRCGISKGPPYLHACTRYPYCPSPVCLTWQGHLPSLPRKACSQQTGAQGPSIPLKGDCWVGTSCHSHEEVLVWVQADGLSAGLLPTTLLYPAHPSTHPGGVPVPYWISSVLVLLGSPISPPCLCFPSPTCPSEILATESHFLAEVFKGLPYPLLYSPHLHTSSSPVATAAVFGPRTDTLALSTSTYISSLRPHNGALKRAASMGPSYRCEDRGTERSRVRLSLHRRANVRTNPVRVGTCSGQYREGNPRLAGFDFVFNF